MYTRNSGQVQGQISRQNLKVKFKLLGISKLQVQISWKFTHVTVHVVSHHSHVLPHMYIHVYFHTFSFLGNSQVQISRKFTSLIYFHTSKVNLKV